MTKRQACHEARHSNTWQNYQKRSIQRIKRDKKKKKKKLSHIQKCLTDQKINFIKINKDKKKQDCIYEKEPPLEKLPLWNPEVVPYLAEHETWGAKMANQEKRALAWEKQFQPKRKNF